MISNRSVCGAGLLLAISIPLFAQPSITHFRQGLPAGSSPTSIALGPDGASWFVEQQSQQIGRITPGGVIELFPLPLPAAGLNGIATGPDGAMWFTEGYLDKIGRMTIDGVVTHEFALPPGSAPFGIVTGPDGALWFTEAGTGKIGRITPAGVLKEFPLPWSGSQLSEIALGTRGGLWFTDGSGNIGLVSATGAFTRFPVPTAGAVPRGITPGPDDSLWFTESGAAKIGRVTTGGGDGVQIFVPPAGIVTEYAIPGGGAPQSIVFGTDGAFWFTDPSRNRLGRITPVGVVTGFDLPAGAQPRSIAVGPDGALWFTESGAIGRALPGSGPLITEFSTLFLTTPYGITTGPDAAIWFSAVVNGTIGRVNTAGAMIRAYQNVITPSNIVTGPDGAFWFTDLYKHAIGRLDTAGNRVSYPVPFEAPYGIVVGPDAALWFTDAAAPQIGRITTSGALTIFPVPGVRSTAGIVVGPDGALWSIAHLGNEGRIVRLTTGGDVTVYPMPPGLGHLSGLALGSDGALWFTADHKIARITTGGSITEYSLPDQSVFPGAIAGGPDGALWFSDGYNKIGRIDTQGVITEYALPPGDRVFNLTTGPDGGVWYTKNTTRKIGRFVPPSVGPAMTTRLFTSNPPGATLTIDGIAYSMPQKFTWPVGSRHTISVATQPDGSGARFPFIGWSDGKPQAHTIVAVGGPAVYVANVGVQYRLTASAPSAGGTITVMPSSPDGFYEAGTTLQVTARANPGFQFAGWTGDAPIGANPRWVVMKSPVNVGAVFAPVSCVYSLTASSASVGPSGGTGTVGLVTDAACPWAAAAPAPWVIIAGSASGTGPATLTYSVAANSGHRTANLTIGGATFLIVQGLSAVGVTPAAGAGLSQSFTFQFSHPAGYQNLGVVNILINNALDGRQACYLAYSQPLQLLYLTTNLGAVAGPGMPLDGSRSLSNSQCLVQGIGSSATASGHLLTLTLNLNFGPAFTGTKIVYLAAGDQSGSNSGWQALGTWTIAAPIPIGPAVGQVTPARSSGTGQSYTFTFSESHSVDNLGILNVLINPYRFGYRACYLAYDQPRGLLYLMDDTGSILTGGIRLNGSGVLANSQCIVHGLGSSAAVLGKTVTLTLNLQFLPGLAGDQVIYLAARNRSETQNTGWQPGGTVTVP